MKRGPVNAFVTTIAAEAWHHDLLERLDGITRAARQKRRADIGEIRAERPAASTPRPVAMQPARERTAPPFANLADKREGRD